MFDTTVVHTRRVIRTPEALERQIQRIHALLERPDSEVTWNDHIPDPDNPSQLRQLDVTIREQGKFTIIECRLWRKAQGVKWIEELMGRRESLHADTVIAVSEAGFTSGARKKAEKHGVLLRDLYQLTPEEIASWGRELALTIYYYEYSDLTLSLGFTDESIPKLDMAVLKAQLQSHPILQSAFDAAEQNLDSLKLLARGDRRNVGFGVRLRPVSVELGGCPVVEVALDGRAKLMEQPIPSHSVVAYGEPRLTAARRDATVEKFVLGQTSIVHHGNKVDVEVDLSGVQLPPFSRARFFRVKGSEVVYHERFAIINHQSEWPTGSHLNVELYTLVP